MSGMKRVNIWYVPWNKYVCASIPICVLLDFAGRMLASVTHVPFWLDTFGTFMASIIGGPLLGALVGLLFQLSVAWMASTPAVVLFSMCTMASAVVFGILVRCGFVLSVRNAAVAGLVLSIFISLIQAPVTLALDGGHCSTNWLVEDLFVRTLAAGWNGPIAAFLSRLAGEMLDKILIVTAVYLVAHGMTDFFTRHYHEEEMLHIMEVVEQEPVGTEKKVSGASEKK